MNKKDKAVDEELDEEGNNRVRFSHYWQDEIGKILLARATKSGEPYRMSLTGEKEREAVIAAVNQGIDSYLTACNIPDRGDSYKHGERSIIATEDSQFWKAGDKLVLANTMEIKLSPESLVVLVRRLMECRNADEEINEAGDMLAGDICGTFNIELI